MPRQTLVFPASYSSKKMYLFQRKGLLANSVNNTMCGCYDERWRNKRPSALYTYSKAADINLTYSVPRRALRIKRHPGVFADYPGMQVLT